MFLRNNRFIFQSTPKVSLGYEASCREPIMLESLVALGLVSNVVQLVQFTVHLLKHMRAARNYGDLDGSSEIRHTTYDLLKQVEAVKAQLDEANLGQEARTQGDEVRQAVAEAEAFQICPPQVQESYTNKH
jgi:hypothetical protein